MPKEAQLLNERRRKSHVSIDQGSDVLKPNIWIVESYKNSHERCHFVSQFVCDIMSKAGMCDTG